MDNNHFLFPDLKVFATVVETGSFTRAAKALGTSTAAISRSIKHLEEQVGVKLLNRTTRRLGATDEGSELYVHTQAGLRQLQSALSTVKSSRTEAKGLLRITSSMAFGRRFVSPAVITFRSKFPEIEVDLSLNDDLVDLIESGIDIAIRGGLPDDARLITRKLAPLPLYVCATPNYLRHVPLPKVPSDLLSASCIRFRFRSTGKLLLWEFADNGTRYSLDVQGPLTVDDIETACSAALAGEGFAQLPGYIAVSHIRQGRLKPILLEHVDNSRGFSLNYINRSEMQPMRDGLFVGHLEKALANVDDFSLNPSELVALRS
jgi:DNA-binding transcriptional LysR family regulator